MWCTLFTVMGMRFCHTTYQIALIPTSVSIKSTFNLTLYMHAITGLPKSAVINYKRAVSIACIFRAVSFRADDILYIALPLYHTVASVLGLGNVIEAGKYRIHST